MRRTVEVKVRVDAEGLHESACEICAMCTVAAALKDYDWFQDADEAEVVDE